MATVGRITRPAALVLRAAREILEPRVLLEEREPHGARRPVALLADDDLGHALGLGLALAVDAVHLLAEDEEHDVGVLLERAGLAQVGELRPMIAARLPARG